MPPQNYLLDGIAYDTDESTVLGDSNISFTNESNGDNMTIKTGADGSWVFDLANFPSGWTNGDVISFTVGGESTRGKFVKIKSICINSAQIRYLKCKVEQE